MYYKTQLRFKVWREVRGKRGLFRVRETARKLGERANSILYQLNNLIKRGLVVKVGNLYSWAKWIHSYGGKKVVKSMVNSFGRRIRELKGKIDRMEGAWWVLDKVIDRRKKELERVRDKYRRTKGIVGGG